MDYGENYTFIIQDAVQRHPLNNKQATIGPFVLHFQDSVFATVYKPYFVISVEMCHDASTAHAFKSRVVARILEEHPTLTHLYYISDSAGSQKIIKT